LKNYTILLLLILLLLLVIRGTNKFLRLTLPQDKKFLTPPARSVLKSLHEGGYLLLQVINNDL